MKGKYSKLLVTFIVFISRSKDRSPAWDLQSTEVTLTEFYSLFLNEVSLLPLKLKRCNQNHTYSISSKNILKL